ncbi:MAG: leucine-rich repeat protein [Clostridia bacterium]|nr:leucine-rich repeat protein [Clostridia bacterium]
MKLKTLFSLFFVLLLISVLAISASAEDTLWAEKPTEGLVDSGYVVNGAEGHTGTDEAACTGDYTTHTPTNIKWEIYPDGSGYALYLSIDDEGYAAAYPSGSYKGNTVVYGFTYTHGQTQMHHYGYASAYGSAEKHPWVKKSGVATSKFTKIVIGDGITELNGGAFVGMNKVTVIEMPASLVKINGAPFKDCTSLATVYSRGQTPIEGTFNLSTVKTFAQKNYLFANCRSVKEYVFAGDAKMSGLYSYEFYMNSSLKSIALPEGISLIQRTAFNDCKALESVIFPKSLNSVNSSSFINCTSLRSVTFKSDATIYYDPDAKTKDDILSSTVLAEGKTYALNSFATCTALSEIVAPVGSKLAEFAFEYGFASLMTLKPTEGLVSSGYVVNGAEGHTDTETTCTGDYSTHTPTNIKWEVYPDGTGYALYLSIDDEGYAAAYPEGAYKGNTVVYGFTYIHGDKYMHQYGYANDLSNNLSASGKHPWVAKSGLSASSFTKIVVGEGITEFNGGTFVGMNKVTVVEMPSTVSKFEGAPFKGCAALKTVYSRGQTPIEGTFNLSTVKTFAQKNYLFANCEAVENYIFASDAKMTGLYGQEFYKNYALKTLTLPEGISMVQTGVFQQCYALESIVLPASLGTASNQGIRARAFYDCTALKTVTFNSNSPIIYAATAETKADIIAKHTDNAFWNCTSLETINAPIGSTAHAFATKFGFNTSHTVELYNGDTLACIMTYHPESKKITIDGVNAGSWEWKMSIAEVSTFMNAYKDKTEHIVFTGIFRKIIPGDAFVGAENLISVCFPKNARVLDYSECRAFANCTSLTTVYFGDEADMKMGVVDFSGMNCNRDDSPTVFAKRLFENCGEITTVILPKLDNTTHSNETTQNTPTIYATTFAGCSKLAYLEIPETFEVIADGAFKDCTALKTINYYAPAELIKSTTFDGSNSGLIIKCQSYADAEAINAALAEGGVAASSVTAFYKSGMSIAGYQVRTSGYNGLRTVFSFYKNAYSNYELVECGSIVATAANFAKYAESFGEENSLLKLEGGEFVTPASNVIKTPIYSGGEFVNNYVKTDGGFRFSVTVTRFEGEAQYKSEIVNCGYEIWEKEDGTYLVVFEREKEAGYESNSLYKTTLGMLCGGAVILEKGNNPLYNVLMDCTYNTFAPAEKVEGYLFADPLYGGKNVAVYLTDSASEIELEESGFSASDADNVSRVVCGKNIKFTLPEIDSYWLEHINEKLGDIPEGKSFIAYTDTHFQSSGTRNTRKSASLIKYVKMLTGIDTVINLGDPYSGEPTLEKSKELLDISMGDYFYDIFGEDGLFTVGNHDSNITTWTTLDNGDVDEGVDGYYATDYLVPDSYIYDVTVKNIANKKNVVFDEAMLSLVDSLDFSAAGSEDSNYGVTYTPEQMKEEFIAWAKMHYYYDDEENGIRYIVINTGSCSLTEYYTLGHTMWNNVLPTQYDFIYNALNSVPCDKNGEYYDVVFAGHQMASNTENSLAQEKIYKILSAFKGGYSVEMTVTHGNKNMQTLIGNANKAYDFSEIGYDGTIFTIGGHWHLDLSTYYGTDETYKGSVTYNYGDAVAEDAIFFIGVNNDCIETYSSTDVSMTRGDYTENCFSVITITPDGEIVLTRFGAGADRKFSYSNIIE